MKITKKGYYRFLHTHNICGTTRHVVSFLRGDVIQVVDIVYPDPSIMIGRYRLTLGYINNDLPVEEVEITKKKELVKFWKIVNSDRVEVRKHKFSGHSSIDIVVDILLDNQQIGVLNLSGFMVNKEYKGKFRVTNVSPAGECYPALFFVYEYV